MYKTYLFKSKLKMAKKDNFSILFLSGDFTYKGPKASWKPISASDNVMIKKGTTLEYPVCPAF